MKSCKSSSQFIELDDGKIYRKALYLMVKTHGFPVDFPLNQPNESSVRGGTRSGCTDCLCDACLASRGAAGSHCAASSPRLGDRTLD